jgi:hypothetical protein
LCGNEVAESSPVAFELLTRKRICLGHDGIVRRERRGKRADT